MVYDVSKVGSNIKAIRGAQKMTMKELGEKACLTESSVCRIENGDRTAMLSTVAKICDALGCSFEQVFGHEPFIVNGGE